MINKTKLLFLLLFLLIFLNFSSAEEFLPVYNFKVGNRTYLFSIYRATHEELVFIFDYNPKDKYLDEARTKIKGKIIEFNPNNNIIIKGVLNENKTSIKLTNFINKKNKTNQKISTPWIKLDEFATHTETFQIGDQEYKISFPIYKDQVKIIKKYDDKRKKLDLIFITNDKMGVGWDKTNLWFSIKKFKEDDISDDVFNQTMKYIISASRSSLLFEHFKKSEVYNHPIKILFKNPKYADLVLSFYDSIDPICILSIYRNNQNINYGCTDVIFLNPSTNTKPSLVLTEKILKEIITQLEKDKTGYYDLANIHNTINSILVKNATLKNINEASKKYEEIDFNNKEIYLTKGKEIINAEDKLNQLIYSYLESEELSEQDPYNQKIRNNNYNESIEIGSGDAGSGFKELNFFFDNFIISTGEGYDPLGALLPYKVKKHPLQIKLESNTYSKSPIYDKFKNLFDLVIKSFYIQDKDGKFIPQLKIDNFFYQNIYLEYPPIDMEYIKKKLEEKGYPTDFENVG